MSQDSSAIHTEKMNYNLFIIFFSFFPKLSDTVEILLKKKKRANEHQFQKNKPKEQMQLVKKEKIT